MNRLLVSIAFFVLSSCLGQSFQSSLDQSAFKQALTEKSASTFTIEAGFTESLFSTLLKAPKTTYGNLAYSTKGGLRWEKTSPYSEVIISDGTIVKQQKNGQLIKDSGAVRVFKKMESLMSVLLSASFLESDQFELTYIENNSTVDLVLKPKRKNMAKHLSHIKLVFLKSNLALAELSIFESASDYVHYIFTEVNYNTTLDPKLFTEL